MSTGPLSITIPRSPLRKRPVTTLLDAGTYRRLKSFARQSDVTVSTALYHIVQAVLQAPVDGVLADESTPKAS